MALLRRILGNKDPQFFLLVIILFGLIAGTWGSYRRALELNQITPHIFFTLLLEAVGTVSALLLIWTAVIQGRKDRLQALEQARADRQLQREESVIERRKERLREQLTFYTPLVGRVLRQDFKVDWKNQIIQDIITELNIITGYELYAENPLKQLFREYFDGKVKTADEFSEFGKKMRRILLEDFDILREEYLSLME